MSCVHRVMTGAAAAVVVKETSDVARWPTDD